MKTLHPVSQTLVAWDEFDFKLSLSLFKSDQLEYDLHLPLSSALFLLLVALKLWVFEKNHNFLLAHGAGSIFRNSPSSRSESAMLSAES